MTVNCLEQSRVMVSVNDVWENAQRAHWTRRRHHINVLSVLYKGFWGRSRFERISNTTTITAQLRCDGRYWGFWGMEYLNSMGRIRVFFAKNAYFSANVSNTSAPARNIVAPHVTSDMSPRHRRTNRIVPDKVTPCYSIVLLHIRCI